jgi:hypothetical protein
MILHDQESVIFRSRISGNLPRLDICIPNNFVFHFSCGLISFVKTQLKIIKSRFFFVPFSQASSQITDPFFASFCASSAL